MVTNIIILNGERSQPNQLPLDIIPMMFRLVMFLVLAIRAEVNLAIDAGKVSFVHIINIRQRV